MAKEHYNILGKAFLGMLGKVLQERMTHEDKVAWAAFYTRVSTYMISHNYETQE